LRKISECLSLNPLPKDGGNQAGPILLAILQLYRKPLLINIVIDRLESPDLRLLQVKPLFNLPNLLLASYKQVFSSFISAEMRISCQACPLVWMAYPYGLLGFRRRFHRQAAIVPAAWKAVGKYRIGTKLRKLLQNTM
jgi:hypothetical protein